MMAMRLAKRMMRMQMAPDLSVFFRKPMVTKGL